MVSSPIRSAGRSFGTILHRHFKVGIRIGRTLRACDGPSLRRWHGGPRPQQNLLAQDAGAALGDRIAAALGERGEALKAASKKPELRLRDHPPAHLARSEE